ncbi:MAG: hypothetical protein RXQ93_02850 [Caldisphaera sp.]
MNSRKRYEAIALMAVAFVLVMALGVIPVTHASTPTVKILSGRGVAFPSVVSPGGQIQLAFNFTVSAPVSGYYVLYLYYAAPTTYVTQPITGSFFLKQNAQYFAANVTLTQSEVNTFLSNIEKVDPSVSSATNITVFVALSSPYTSVYTTTSPTIGTNQFTLLLQPALTTKLTNLETGNLSYYNLYNVMTNNTLSMLVNLTPLGKSFAQYAANKTYWGLPTSNTNVTASLYLMNNFNYPILLLENQTEYNPTTKSYENSSSSALLETPSKSPSKTYTNGTIFLYDAINQGSALPTVTNNLQVSNGFSYSYYLGNILQLNVYNHTYISLTAGSGNVVELLSSTGISTVTSFTENASLYSLTNVGVSTKLSTILNVFPSVALISNMTNLAFYPGEDITYNISWANFPVNSNITSFGLYYINPVTGMVTNTSALVVKFEATKSYTSPLYEKISGSNTTFTGTEYFNVTLPLNDPYWGSLLFAFVSTNTSVMTYGYSPLNAAVYPVYYVDQINKEGVISGALGQNLLLGQYLFVYGYGFKPGINVANIFYETNGTTKPVGMSLMNLVTPNKGSNLNVVNGSGVFYFVSQIPYTGVIANNAVQYGEKTDKTYLVFFNVSTLSISNVKTYNDSISNIIYSWLDTSDTGDAIVYVNPYIELTTPGEYIYVPQIVSYPGVVVPYNSTQPFTLMIDGQNFTFPGIAPVSAGELTVQIIGANASALYNTLYLQNGTLTSGKPIVYFLIGNVTLTNGYGVISNVKVPNANGSAVLYANVTSFSKKGIESSAPINNVSVGTAYEIIVGKMPIYGAYGSNVVSGLDNTTFLVLQNVPITVVGWGFVPGSKPGLVIGVNGVGYNVSAIMNGYAEGTIYANSTYGFILTGKYYNVTLLSNNVEIYDQVSPAVQEQLYFINEIVVPVQVIFSGSTVSVGEPYVAYVVNPLLTLQTYNSQLASYTYLFMIGPSHTTAFVYNGNVLSGKVMSAQSLVPTPPTMYSFLVWPPSVSQGQLVFDYNVSLIYLPWPSLSANAYGIGEAGIVSNSTLLSESLLTSSLSSAVSSVEANVTSQLSSLSSTVSNDYNSLSKMLSDVNSSLSSSLAALSASVSSVNSGVESLQTTVSSLANQLTSLQSSLNSVSSTVNSINSAVSSLSSTVSSDYNSMSTMLSNVNSTLTSQLSSLSSTVNSINSAVSSLSSTVSSDYNSMSTMLSNVNSTLTSQLSSLSSTVNSINSAVSSLSSTVSSDYNSMSTMLSNVNSTLTSQLSSLSSTVSSVSSTVSSLSTTVSSLSTTVSSLSTTVSSLSTTVSSVSSTVSSLSSLPSSVSSLQSSVSEASSKAGSAELYGLGALIVAIIVLILIAYVAFAKV